MANKKELSDEKMLTIDEWKQKQNVPNHVIAGVCVRNRWRKNTQVTQTDFLKAVEVFLKSGMGGNR